MSEILLTPRPEPVSPVDPTLRLPKRAPSQSTEFFDAVCLEGMQHNGGGATKPLRVVKKRAPSNVRSSTVSVPSSPVSMRSSDSHAQARKTISKLFMTADLASNEVDLTATAPVKNEQTSTGTTATTTVIKQTQAKPMVSPTLPLTPPMTPIRSPRRPNRRHQHPLPLSPVTPSRAPAKALKLLGTGGPPPNARKQKDRFRPLPKSTLLEVERFFGTATASRKPSAAAVASKKAKDEEIFAWLLNDPSNRDGRTDMGRYVSDEEDPAAALHAKGKGGKSVEESFVDCFGDKPKSKAKVKGNKRKQARPAAATAAIAPHPWSAAALAAEDIPVPTLSYSSTESGPSSPDSEVTLTPPRRPKRRPRPLVLDLKPKANLPIVILNSPPARTPVRRARLGSLGAKEVHAPAAGTPAAQTPFVHPRRAPKPKPRALDLTKAALPRMTDVETRMPLLPPIQFYQQRLTPDGELPISIFEPVTPTDAYHPGEKRERGGWLKKVVKDLGHMKI